MSGGTESQHQAGPSSGASVLLRPPPPRPITRRVVSDRDDPQSTQSLPPSSTVTPKLWNAVRQRVRVTSALKTDAQLNKRRSRAFEDVRRFDDEGITSDTLRTDIGHLLAPGQYTEQWQSLAHLFDAGEDDAAAGHSRSSSRPSRKSKRLSFAPSRAEAPYSPSYISGGSSFVANRPISHIQNADETNPDDSLASFAGPSSLKGSSSFKLRSRVSNSGSQAPASDRKDVTAATASPPFASTPRVADSNLLDDFLANRVSLSDEPVSMLADDPDQTPLGEDPLLYSTQEHLLETDSESDSDTESDTEDDDETQVIRKPHLGVNGSNSPHARNGEAHGASSSSGSPISAQILSKGRAISEAFASVLAGDRLTLLHRSIIKCVLAYLFASLFTYSPGLSQWLASFLPNNDPDNEVPFSNLHMIATVATYFHPAKTVGAMIEADIFALGAFVYAITLGFCSMAIAVFLHETNRLIISDIISVLFFLGLGMALVGFAKIKVAKPTFNTACSLISIIVFTVVVKEGSMHLGHFSTEKTFQVTLVVVAGSLISNIVCFYVWPQSATTNLQTDIVRNMRGFSTLLRVLTKTFLLEDPSNFHFKSDRIKRAIDDHHDSFTSLKKNLEEAKLEALFDLRMRGMSSKYVDATDSLNRLAQHLAGLRSSCGLQHQIMVARREAQRVVRDQDQTTNVKADAQANDTSPNPRPRPASTRLADLFETGPDFGESAPDNTNADNGAEATAFEDFIASVGPHMRSLVFSCCRTLKGLRSTFVARDALNVEHKALAQEASVFSTANGGTGTWHDFGTTSGAYIPGTSFEGLQTDISNALRRFQHEQTVAIKRIYTMEPKKMAQAQAQNVDDSTATAQEGSNGVGSLLQKSNGDEAIFLIFFFVFNLKSLPKSWKC